MEQFKVGYCAGRAYDGSRRNWSDDGPRPIVWSAWYPANHNAVEQVVAVPTANPLFIMGTVARDAALKGTGERCSATALQRRAVAGCPTQPASPATSNVADKPTMH